MIASGSNLPYQYLEDGLSEAGFVDFAFGRVKRPMLSLLWETVWGEAMNRCASPLPYPIPEWSEYGVSIIYCLIIPRIGKNPCFSIILKTSQTSYFGMIFTLLLTLKEPIL